MPIIYKKDIVQALKNAGYSTYRIRKEKIMGEATLQKLRLNEPVSWEMLAVLCRLLRCQPGDLMEYVEG
ncbi:helix-turn-helix transcriptional regulator [Oscillibacter sp.]|uniref:helix-turn-helix domain-containing protein n=1 Tax=Oscillibacter sp. TaxID=1945593 RepID=UPI0025EE4E54|nr:helix-turn-helix transcriptional regulator [Oscillibacter sp.]